MKLNATTGAALVAAFAVHASASAAIIFVSSTADSTVASDGACTFREAILNANGDVDTTGGDCAVGSGIDLIAFAIPGAGPHVITPATALPDITEGVTIDGFASQPGSMHNTNPIDQPINAVLKIVLDGVLLAGTEDGLSIAADDVIVRGLVIHRFPDDGITIASLIDDSVIEGCFIGTDVTGLIAMSNGDDGVVVRGHDHLIGGEAPTARCLISGNAGTGIRLTGTFTSQNYIRGCFIGVDATGTAALGNGDDGIESAVAHGTFIGGSEPGRRNVISGNGEHGIRIRDNDFGSSAWVRNCLIGTDRTGLAAVPNGANGILVEDAESCRIGISSAGGGNVISGNTLNGVVLQGAGSTDNRIENNFIGAGDLGTTDLGNGENGVRIQDAHDNRIGGATPAARNVISGNGLHGVKISAADGNQVQGNHIGADVTGTVAIPNDENGVLLTQEATQNVVGTDGDGTDDAGEGNLISGNAAHGVALVATDPNPFAATVGLARERVLLDLAPMAPAAGRVLLPLGAVAGNVIAGNRIGTDVSGIVCLGNGAHGVRVSFGVPDTVIGTNGDGAGDALEGNVISCNGTDGVNDQGDRTIIAGNRVGTDASGTTDLGNGDDGLDLINTDMARVGTNGDGTSDALERNVISGNGDHGVEISEGRDGVVAGNVIGTDASGTGCLPNDNDGVQVDENARRFVIGTNGDGVGDDVEGNVISCNAFNGVRFDETSGNTVAGNLIGTNATGDGCLGNGDRGVDIFEADGILVGTNGDGTSDALEGNVISCNGAHGIRIFDEFTSDNIVAGNLIGTDAACGAALPNDEGGILIGNGARENRIGTDGDGVSDENESNVISGNAGVGVEITSPETDMNVVAGNFIGTDGAGAIPIPNGGDGVRILDFALSNLVGSDGDGINDAAESNVIAHNTGTGVEIGDDSVDNAILGNAIFGNAGLGIDLRPGIPGGAGVTPNDPQDPDDGPNRFQNFPVFIEASPPHDLLFHLNATPNTQFRIEFFGSSTPDPSGHGEGEQFLGFIDVTTDGAGDAAIAASLPALDPVARPWVTATATRFVDEICGVALVVPEPRGDTSEFSEATFVEIVDCNGNGVLDESETAPEPQAGSDDDQRDDCTDALHVCPGVVYEGTTAGATPDGPLTECDDNYLLNDVWYRYRAAWSGPLLVSTYTSVTPMVVEIWDGCPGAGGFIEDCASWPTTDAKLIAEAKGEYWIRLSGLGLVDGPFTLTLVGPDCALNALDCNANTIPDECECLADVNGDGTVDIFDFAQVNAMIGIGCSALCPEDVDGDGTVDDADALIVLNSLGKCPFPQEPEPCDFTVVSTPAVLLHGGRGQPADIGTARSAP